MKTQYGKKKIKKGEAKESVSKGIHRYSSMIIIGIKKLNINQNNKN
ncbi:MAG: hypothetical protein Q8L81_09005 [Bacteroidota bacterium]|nr:hypothetical protein [Bacteroidota bacterium]